MGRRDDLIEKYAEDLRTKCSMDPDMDLLRKVTIACGPTIYNRDSATISGGDTKELNIIKQNFLIKKLGLEDDDSLMGGIQSSLTTYGRENRSKYRAVFNYLLVKHFSKEGSFA